MLSSSISRSTTRRSLRSTPRSVRARRSMRRDLNSFRHQRRRAKWAGELPRPRRPADRASRAKHSRQRTTTASRHSPGGRLDVVGNAGAHPDELPWRVMQLSTAPSSVAVIRQPMITDGLGAAATVNGTSGVLRRRRRNSRIGDHGIARCRCVGGGSHAWQRAARQGSSITWRGIEVA